jgi:hypothetical protein
LQVLREARLDPERHKPTGNTRHHLGGEVWEGTHALRIVRYPDDPGFSLLYLDEGGEEVTDTWHESMEDAVHQADFEFHVKDEDWTLCT